MNYFSRFSFYKDWCRNSFGKSSFKDSSKSYFGMYSFPWILSNISRANLRNFHRGSIRIYPGTFSRVFIEATFLQDFEENEFSKKSSKESSKTPLKYVSDHVFLWKFLQGFFQIFSKNLSRNFAWVFFSSFSINFSKNVSSIFFLRYLKKFLTRFFQGLSLKFMHVFLYVFFQTFCKEHFNEYYLTEVFFYRFGDCFRNYSRAS